MPRYIDCAAIKLSVANLKKAKVSGSPFLAYLILRRHSLLQGTDRELSITGKELIPAVRDAAMVNEESVEAAFFSPVEGKYNTKRWGETNGPSDAISKWPGRDGGRDIVEKLSDRDVMTVNLLPFNADAVHKLLNIKDAGRPDIVDMAVWWYRDKDIEPLLDANGVLTAQSLVHGFREQVKLTGGQTDEMFASPSAYDDTAEFSVTDSKADPVSYLPPFVPRRKQTVKYEMKNYEKGSCEQLIDAVNQSGYIFTPEQVATYLTAVRTKPFVILAGVSGTGKTHLPITLAKSTGSDYFVCSVQPDWTDSSSLMGYTDIQGKFHPGLLLNYARKAMNDPAREYFFLLDEMNLARVEYYLSDVLSKMETMDIDKSTGKLQSEPLMPDVEGYKDIVLPSNLCFVGSINMDESTQPISKKVLDRAFVLDFNEVDLTIAQTPAAGQIQTLQWSSEEWGADRKPLFGTIGLDPDEFAVVTSKLSDINNVMRMGGFNFGYRLRNEICAFIANAKTIDTVFSDSDTSSSAFDIALKTKALSRIEGQGIIVNDVIKAFRECLTTNEEGDTVADAKTRFQRTLNKLSDMADMFDRTGYASYWN